MNTIGISSSDCEHSRKAHTSRTFSGGTTVRAFLKRELMYVKMIRLSRPEGFSLIETMIVVTIMSVLVAVAFPTYTKMQIRARESEVYSNMANIRICQEAYKAESGVYIDCVANPADVPTDPVHWPLGCAGWEEVGFEPFAGVVRYQYEVVIGAASSSSGTDATSYDVFARGDVDRDTEVVVWSVNETSAIPLDSPKGEH
jgi:prepilin-type N-terminal cleavage/methylation domain-containing protein